MTDITTPEGRAELRRLHAGLREGRIHLTPMMAALIPLLDAYEAALVTIAELRDSKGIKLVMVGRSPPLPMTED